MYGVVKRQIEKNSPKEEELAGQCLLQEVPMEKPLRKLGHYANTRSRQLGPKY